ncbi:MAG: hypothetical protein ACREK4_18385 [Candidatus Rokuibacteriota bacterium]
MVYRRYHRFIPNLRGRDVLNAARELAGEGLWSLETTKGLRVFP